MVANAAGSRKLHKGEIEQLRDHFIHHVNLEDPLADQAVKAALRVGTRVDLPLGELLNPEMKGLLRVWLQTRAFVLGRRTSQHRLIAQGIEPIVRIEDIPLSMALLAAIKTGVYRIEIFVPCNWTYPAFHRQAPAGGDRTDEEVEE